MATVTRVTGLQATVGTVYAVNANLFLLTVKKLIPDRLEHMLANYILTLYKRMVIMFIQY